MYISIMFLPFKNSFSSILCCIAWIINFLFIKFIFPIKNDVRSFLFCIFEADLVKAISRHVKNNKKRYAYLVNWKPRKFLKRTRMAQWFSRIAWAAITHSCVKVFLGPPIQKWHSQYHASTLNKDSSEVLGWLITKTLNSGKVILKGIN